jgi:hypothetical protein
MNHDMNQTDEKAGQAKFYVIPVVILATWLALFGGSIASVVRQPSLPDSIEHALRPTSSPPTSAVALASAP